MLLKAQAIDLLPIVLQVTLEVDMEPKTEGVMDHAFVETGTSMERIIPGMVSSLGENPDWKDTPLTTLVNRP